MLLESGEKRAYVARGKCTSKLLCFNESLEGCGWAATAQPVSWFAHAA